MCLPVNNYLLFVNTYLSKSAKTMYIMRIFLHLLHPPSCPMLILLGFVAHSGHHAAKKSVPSSRWHFFQPSNCTVWYPYLSLDITGNQYYCYPDRQYNPINVIHVVSHISYSRCCKD